MISSPYQIFTANQIFPSIMNITFDNAVTCKVRNAAPLDRENLQEILNMAPGYGWSIATEYKAGRVYAKFSGERAGRRGHDYEHELNPQQMHLKAALRFIQAKVTECSSFRLVSVQSRSESGYVFTFI